jgi:hypothetical protein
MPNGAKRDLASLGNISIEKKRVPISQKRHYYAARQRRHRTLAVERSTESPTKEYTYDPPTREQFESSQGRLYGDRAADRRSAIKYVFQTVLLSPPKDAWQELGTIPDIIYMLRIPPGSWGTVHSVISQLDEDADADVRGIAVGQGRKAAIVDFTDEAEFIYRCLEKGNSIGTTTILLNNGYRRPKRLPSLSYSAVARFVHQSPVIVIARRKTRKSGKDDEGTPWAQARLAFATQLLEQLELGRLTPAERVARASQFPPLFLHAIAWWDEHHKKGILGHTSKLEARVYRNAVGKAAVPADGGKLPECKPNTNVKYPPEARMLFGVAMVKQADGNCVGVKAEPFSYTGCQVVGVSAYKKAVAAEIQRAKALKTRVRESSSPACRLYLSHKRVFSQSFDYKIKFGDRWEEEMRRKLRCAPSKIICVTELIDHVISESTRLYAGTDVAGTFCIFHDGLTAWWEPEAQAYIKDKGFQDRQLRSLGTTNSGNRYKGKPVGDSPELCRGLDSFGFAHLQRAVRLHTAMTSCLPPGHASRFNMGTANEVESTLMRCWTVAPTSEQIVEDIQALERVLQRIIGAKGCVVDDLFLRSGRRERAADGTPATGKRKRQVKKTFTDLELHKDCGPALLLLENDDVEAILAVDEAAAEAAVELYSHTPDDEAMDVAHGD